MDLEYVQDTLESVRQTSLQAVHMYSYAPDQFRALWNDSFARGTAPHRITLLHVASEILQLEKHSNPSSFCPLTQSLSTLFPPAFAAVARDLPEFGADLLHMLHMWRERDLLSHAVLNDIHHSLDSTSQEISSTAAASIAGVGTAAPPVVEAMIETAPVAAALEDVDLMQESSLPAAAYKEEMNFRRPQDAWVLDVCNIRSSENLLSEDEQECFRHIQQLEDIGMQIDLGSNQFDRNSLHLYQVLVSLREFESEAQVLKSTIPHIAKYADVQASNLQDQDAFDVVEEKEAISLECKTFRVATETRRELMNNYQEEAFQCLDLLAQLLSWLREKEKGRSEVDDWEACKTITQDIERLEEVENKELVPLLNSMEEAKRKKPRVSRWEPIVEAPPAPVAVVAKGWGQQAALPPLPSAFLPTGPFVPSSTTSLPPLPPLFQQPQQHRQNM